MMWTSTAMVNECASVKMLGSGFCSTWSSSCLVAGCIPRRSPTNIFWVSRRSILCHARGLSASFQDMQDTLATLRTFGKSLEFSVHTLVKTQVVAPVPAAPLLTDTCRSAVGSGTREDIVAVAGKLRYMTRFMSVTFGGLVCLGALRDARWAS